MDANDRDCTSKETEFSVPPSPSSILGIYTHYLKTSADGSPILVHEIYQKSITDFLRDGFYFDTLKSDREDLSIILKTPTELRNSLKDNSVYLLMGIIEENISLEKVELIFVVTRIIGEFNTLIVPAGEAQLPDTLGDLKSENSASETRDFKTADLKGVIKNRVIANETIHVLMITGDKVLIPDGFKKALGNAIKSLTISVLHSLELQENELFDLVKGSVSKSYDVIVLAGTWWNKFNWACNNVDLTGLLKQSTACLVTVYGYNRQKTLLDQISHKQFRSLNHFGSRLKVLIDSVYL
jgi:hypothetical protein